MTRVEMKRKAGISSASLAKLGKDANVSMNVLKKICEALQCNIGDIMDILPDSHVETTVTCEIQNLMEPQYGKSKF